MSVDHTASALRAWAPLVASGYEVPIASQTMLQAAQYLENLTSEEGIMRAAQAAAKHNTFSWSQYSQFQKERALEEMRVIIQAALGVA